MFAVQDDAGVILLLRLFIGICSFLVLFVSCDVFSVVLPFDCATFFTGNDHISAIIAAVIYFKIAAAQVIVSNQHTIPTQK